MAVTTIYETLGGEVAVETVVDELYRRLLDDPVTKGYFDGIDMDRLAKHQRAFITAALGGPDRYAGRSLVVAHGAIGVTDEAFDQTAQHLVAILQESDVDGAIIAQIGEFLATLRPDIVTA